MKNIIYYKKLKNINDIPTEEQIKYSKMKYWEYDSLEYFANKLYSILNKTLNKNETYYLSSSPYWHVETAANQIAKILKKILLKNDYKIESLKITRHWWFNIDNYAELTEEERKRIMDQRKLSIPENINLENKNLIILDDIKLTWKHQIKIEEWLWKTKGLNITFLYIFYNKNTKLEWNQEAILNEKYTNNDIHKIITFFNHPKYRINSRTVKFLLNEEKTNLNENLLKKIPKEQLKRMFLLSKWTDKYHLWKKYKKNFNILKEYMNKNDLNNNKIIRYDAKIDKNGNCIIDWEIHNDLLDKYSRFKFWDQNEIKFFAKELANKFISNIKKDNYTKLFFKSIGKDELLYLIAPWIRNVPSASNMLMKYFALYVNPFLSKNNFPTFIIKTLTRTKSWSANYAELTEEERIKHKENNERTIVPIDEFIEKKAHIFFIDDVEVTGATYKRIKDLCIKGNVLSFTSLFIFRIVNDKWEKEWKLEHYINRYTINWTIQDQNLTKIINDIHFSPVQRLLRVVLSTKNEDELLEFYENKITNKDSLLSIYYYAMSNDYLWIKEKEYNKWLLLLEEYLLSKNLI